MASIKSSVGTPLTDVPELDSDTRRRLGAVSVTTAEELLGLIGADPRGTERLLPGISLGRLESDVAVVASRSAAPNLAEAPDETFFTGAVPPATLQEVPVTLEAIERRAADQEMVAGGPAGSGPDLRECFSPIRHQGSRGSCVAFATCALAECLERREGADVDLSEQHLYWNAKQHDGEPDGEGTLIEVAMARMQADGVCTEATWPYVADPIPGNESQAPAPDSAAGDAAHHQLSQSSALPRHDLAAVQGALDQDRPVALSVPTYPSWTNNAMLKLSGFIPMPLPGSTDDGGHAMCAVGYDFDDEFAGGGYFILRNSWGEGFAPQSPIAPGYALLPFSYWEEYGWEVFVAAR